jgi:hypothetical protein
MTTLGTLQTRLHQSTVECAVGTHVPPNLTCQFGGTCVPVLLLAGTVGLNFANMLLVVRILHVVDAYTIES